MKVGGIWEGGGGMLLDHSPQLPGHSIKLGLNHARLDLRSPHMDSRKENGNYYIIDYNGLHFGVMVGKCRK